ncbi:MAG TPA: LptF/LptG family permease [Sphingobacterium sp.]|nr:LptF/LptG family permease [Sphingobacterium sp.]
MKKVHLLILKAFIRPFLVTFCIVMFVLLMLFLFKYIDDLIGKGFEWYVILELLGYQTAVQLSMALPLSMLLSSIMTFGNLGESYELVAIKASGISLRKAMTPLFILVGLFSAGSFLFSDYILPVVNLKMGSLLWDVRNQKAEFLIKPGIFNSTIPGYSIRARNKNKDGTILYDLMIYDHGGGNPGNNVLLSKEGYIHNSADNRYMILQLRDGVRYEESTVKGAKRYDPRRQFVRFYFEESEQKFNMETFQMKRTDENLFKSLHQMLNLQQLKLYTDSNQRTIDSVSNVTFEETKYYYHYFSRHYQTEEGDKTASDVKVAINIDSLLNGQSKRTSVNNALSQTQQILDILHNNREEFKAYSDKDIRYRLEFHRKFTLAVSCLLLFGIGAPLGAIIRKGGLGLPVVMAIFFFLIYHIIATVAEKAARDGSLEALPGMWMAIFILTPVAIFLTYKSTTDSSLFDIEQYRLKLESFWEWMKKKLKIRS